MGRIRVKLSIITCVYNNTSFLEEAFQSVIMALNNLSFYSKEYEWIVVDSSTDKDCIDLVERYASYFTLYKMPAKGIYAAINYGLMKSKGAFISYVHSDDLIDPYFFKNSQLLNTPVNKNIYCEYGKIQFIKEQQELHYRNPPFFLSILQKKTNLIFHPNGIYRRSFEVNNLYDCNVGIEADWHHLKLLKKMNVIRNKNMIYKFRISPFSSTVQSNSRNMNVWNSYLLLFENKLLKRLWYIIFTKTRVWSS